MAEIIGTCCCGISNPCCPGVSWPSTMYAHICKCNQTGCSATWTAPVTVSLVWNGSEWTYTGNVGGKCSADLTIKFWCDSGTFKIQINSDTAVSAGCVNCYSKEILFGYLHGGSAVELPSTCCASRFFDILVTTRTHPYPFCCDCGVIDSQNCGLTSGNCNVSQYFDLTMSGWTNGCGCSRCSSVGCDVALGGCQCTKFNGTFRLEKRWDCRWIVDIDSLTQITLLWADPPSYNWILDCSATFNTGGSTLCYTLYKFSGTWNCCSGSNTLNIHTPIDGCQSCCNAYPSSVTITAAGECVRCCAAAFAGPLQPDIPPVASPLPRGRKEWERGGGKPCNCGGGKTTVPGGATVYHQG